MQSLGMTSLRNVEARVVSTRVGLRVGRVVVSCVGLAVSCVRRVVVSWVGRILVSWIGRIVVSWARIGIMGPSFPDTLNPKH